MQVLLDSVSAHPYGVLILVAASALLASLAVVGSLVPARAVLFAAGAPAGWFTLGMAVLGAAVDDGLSYALGRRYRDEVRGWWISNGRDAALVRDERFVVRQGSKSILVARFAAPVLTVVPLVAGVARMPRGRFHAINMASALAWSSVHLFPGMLFGVTARLAQALNTRLAVLLLIVAAPIWLTTTLTRLGIERGVQLVASGIRHALHRLNCRHAAVAQRLFVILDPGAPDFRIRAVLALLLVGSVWLIIVIVAVCSRGLRAQARCSPGSHCATHASAARRTPSGRKLGKHRHPAGRGHQQHVVGFAPLVIPTSSAKRGGIDPTAQFHHWRFNLAKENDDEHCTNRREPSFKGYGDAAQAATGRSRLWR